LAEGVAVVVVGGVDAALEAFELAVEVGGALPEARFDAAEAAEEPFGVDQGVDAHALDGRGGVVVAVVFGAEGVEVFRVFAGEDGGVGVDAGLQGIETGSGFALDGARAGGFLSVAAVGLDLLESCHGG